MQSDRLILLGLNSFVSKKGTDLFVISFAYPNPKPNFPDYYDGVMSFVTKEQYDAICSKKIKQFNYFSGNYHQNVTERVDANGNISKSYSIQFDNVI